MIHLHKWSKWADIPLDIRLPYVGKWQVLGQIRECARCGKKTTREIR